MNSVDLITTGRPDLTEYAGENGFLVGARLDHEPGYGRTVDFLDMEWGNPEPERLIDAADRNRPKYVVAGDYLRDEDNVSRVNDRARELREYAENVIVVPKSPGDLDLVPEWCVVGYSVPTDYGGTDIPLPEYRSIDNPIHVLGGTPHRQIRTLGHLWTDNVVSMDSNSHHKAATIGAKAWFPEKPRWRKINAPGSENAVEKAYWKSIDNLRVEYEQRGLLPTYPND